MSDTLVTKEGCKSKLTGGANFRMKWEIWHFGVHYLRAAT